MHLPPADRSEHRVIDAERICPAIAALDRPEVIAERDGRPVRYRPASSPTAALLAGEPG